MSGWIFSNFRTFDKPLTYREITYPTVEHFYQAMKSKDPDYRRKVSELSTATEAKKAGRSVELRPDWESIKVKVMEYALRHKFSEGTSHFTALHQTSGYIVESNYWHDNEWGDCTCNKCKVKGGKNLLGKLLMQIRDEKFLFQLFAGK